MSRQPRNIPTHAIVYIEPHEVRPGHLIAEGLVLVAEARDGGYWYQTPGNVSVFAAPGEQVQVYAAISEDDAATARAAYGYGHLDGRGRPVPQTT